MSIAAKDNTHFDNSLNEAIVRVDAEHYAGRQCAHFQCKQIELPGGLIIYDIIIDPVIIKRHANHIVEDSVHDYFLSTLLEGTAHIEQAGRKHTLKRGDLALIASGLPYTTEYEEPSRRLIVRIPNQVFRERLIHSEQIVITGTLPRDGLGRIVNELLKSVAFEASALPSTDQYTLVQSLLELTAALTRSSLKLVHPAPRHADLLKRILNYLEAHFMDSDLNPGKIAAAHGISTRYLHSLFRQSGTTVFKWLWERRLKATRSEGFSAPAHFSRTFRKRFGITPTQLRARTVNTH